MYGASRSKENSSEDWAVLKLSSSLKRRSAKAKAITLPHKTEVTAYPTYFSFVDTTIDGARYPIPRGVIKKRECSTSMTNLLSSSYNYDASANIGLSCDSEIVSGNSGSGLYQGGQLVALVNSVWKKNDEIKGLFQNNKISIEPYQDGYYVHAGSVYCISYFNSNHSQNDCKEYDLGITPALFRAFVEQSENQREELNDSVAAEYAGLLELGPQSEDYVSLTVGKIRERFSSVPEEIFYTNFIIPAIETSTQVPHCVANEALNEQEFEFIGRYTSLQSDFDLSKISIDLRGELLWSQDIMEESTHLIRYKKEKDEKTNQVVFKGSYVRAEKDVQEKIQGLISKLEEDRTRCESRTYAPIACSAVTRHKNDLLQIKASFENNGQLEIYNNEQHIYEYPELADYVFEISVCEEEKP